MSNRKRVNISLDPETYEKLQQIQREHKFKNLCEMLTALAHILIDRMQVAEQRKYDLPEDDGQYIDSMFDDLSNTQRVPDGTVPVRHNSKKLR